MIIKLCCWKTGSGKTTRYAYLFRTVTASPHIDTEAVKVVLTSSCGSNECGCTCCAGNGCKSETRLDTHSF